MIDSKIRWKRHKSKQNRRDNVQKNKDHYDHIINKLNSNDFEREFRIKERQLEKKKNYEKQLKELKKQKKHYQEIKQYKKMEKQEVSFVIKSITYFYFELFDYNENNLFPTLS